MRALALIALVACRPIPEPQPPRTVCNGVMVPAGAAVAMNSVCYHLPADPCWDDDSEECQEAAREREEANKKARTNNMVALILLGSATVVLIGALIVTH